MKGVFIAVEGLDGCGKDTQIDLLKKRPELKDAVFTREPGGTEAGDDIRTVLLKKGGLAPETQLLLFFAARAEHLAKVIRPALEKGKTVISNRFALSTIAYEVDAPGRPDLFPLYRSCMQEVVQGTLPHYVLLDVPAEVPAERMKQRAIFTHYDAKELDFHDRVRHSMLAHVSEGAPSAVVDGSQSPEKVSEDVWKAVSSWI